MNERSGTTRGARRWVRKSGWGEGTLSFLKRHARRCNRRGAKLAMRSGVDPDVLVLPHRRVTAPHVD